MVNIIAPPMNGAKEQVPFISNHLSRKKILKWIIFWKILLIFPKYCQVFSKNKILAPNKRSQEWAFFYQLFKRKYFTAEMNQFIFNKIIGEMRMVLQILVSDKYMLQFFKMEKRLRPFWNFKSINFHSQKFWVKMLFLKKTQCIMQFPVSQYRAVTNILTG